MKSAWISPVVGLLGVGLGWILGGLMRDETLPEPVADPVDRIERPADPPSEPTLVGLPVPMPSTPTVVRAAPPPDQVGPSAADLEVLEEIDPDEFGRFVILEETMDPATGDARGWHALLTLYALAGRLEDFQRVVPRALEAGLDRDVLLGLLQLLPVEKHVAALDHVLKAFPEGAWNVGTIADIYTNAGANERAVDVLVPVLEAGADVDLASRLVRADPDRAARILGAMTTAEGWSAEMLGQLGAAFVEAERPDLALTFLQDALGREPVNYAVLMSLRTVDPDLALAHARRLTEQHADRADVWTWLGQLEADVGDGEAAFEAYRRAAALGLTTEVLFGMVGADPERAYEAAVELSANVTDDEVLGAVAKVALKGGKREDTLATLLRAHELDPSDHEWMTAMVALDPQRAAEIIGQTAGSYGGEGRDEVVGAHGNALLETGRAGDAYERYREAYELDPSDWEWQRGLARADPDRAIPLLEARREEAGDEGDLLGALADAYAGAGRREEAVALYQRAVDVGGGDEWYARMGQVDGDRALTALQQRVRESPEAADTWGALGELHRARGEKEAARDAYDKARALNTTNLFYEIRYREMGG